MPKLQALLSEGSSELLHECADGLSELEPLMHHIASRIVPEPPMMIRDGGIFQVGVDEKLDDLRIKAGEGTDWLKGFEAREKERLDIPSLKVKQNRQFGFFIEVTKSHLDKVPDEYHRRQTMTNAERYTTDELKEWEEIILTADDRAKALEYELFLELRKDVASYATNLSSIGRKVASADVLASFAYHARKRSWTRPDIRDDTMMDITNGRHPVLEEDGRFVPNGINFHNKRRFLLLTGPNMGGKSTYLRQTALITILAQTGAFVPAEKARIGIVDRVFTRVGAHDDLRRGRSTFMMEMIEVAHILRRASPRSLILLDEVGRGTSTFDGLAIAWSVTEDISKRIGARTLFATHYHQLTGLAEEVDGLVNVHVQVADVNGDIRFLHTVADGPCDDSYGVQVAALAGLPSGVVERARDLLIFLEGQASGARAGGDGTPDSRSAGQSSLYGWMLPKASTKPDAEPPSQLEPVKEIIVQEDPILREITERLEALDPDSLTPREALEALYAMQSALRKTNETKELEE
jgi:DNA mismatch repair protein MutS